jgi:hypothetical protein
VTGGGQRREEEEEEFFLYSFQKINLLFIIRGR